MSNKAEKEIWKIYPEIPFIEASNLGRVRTKDHWVTYKNGKRQLYKGHVLRQWLLPNGYMQVHVYMNGKIVNLHVHRIIAASHLPNPNNLPEVNHKDNDPTNNRLDNLEWCTHAYNIAYREKCGTACNCPVIAINIETSEVFWFESQREAGRQLGICHSDITKIVKGKRYHKTAGGYWFTYADENAVEKVRVKFGDEIAKKVEELMKHK